MDINTHTIQGRLGEDPKIHRTDRGSIARLRVATNYRYKNLGGEWATKTTWHTVIVRGNDVEMISGARRGDGIFVTGFPEDQEFVDGNGIKRSQRQLIATTVSRPLQVMSPTQVRQPRNQEAPRQVPQQQRDSGYADSGEQQESARGYREPPPARQSSQRQPNNSSPAPRSTPPPARREPVQAPVEREQNRPSPAFHDAPPPVDEFADLDSQISGGTYDPGY